MRVQEILKIDSCEVIFFRIEKEVPKAVLKLQDSVLFEYWGESIPTENRISRWIEMVDSLAKNWKSSKCLFLGSVGKLQQTKILAKV